MNEIVIVEDCEVDAALLRRALNYLSVANPVRHFQAGAEAIAHLDSVAETAPIDASPISIFFLDLVLPGMSGFQILQHIVTQPAFDKTLRVILTNLSDTETIKRSYALGAHSFLIKPVKTSDVRELIAGFPRFWSFEAPTFPERAQTNAFVRDDSADPVAPGT